MAQIKKISFSRVGRNDGCLCDKCGTYIQKIVTVKYDDGVTLNYGQQCFDKMWKSGKLTAHGKKLFSKTIKDLEKYQKEFARWENDPYNKENLADFEKVKYWGDCWKNSTFEEYREWMLNKWFPRRFEEVEKELERFGKVSFDR